MGYEGPHTASKQSAISNVFWYLSQMSWIEVAFYLIIVSVIAYFVKKKLEKSA